MTTAVAEIPAVYGTNPQSVIDTISARAARWRAGDTRDDGRKIGLIIEGGGMRGVSSGGGAVALAQLGFTELFDEVYATSAGAMNAAYFLSHQGELGITIYYENLAGRKFINPLRLWKVLDVDWVFSHVVTIAKPLDVNAILAGRPKFFVAVMDRHDGSGHLIDVKNSRTPVLDVLKAATAIPVLYNRSILVENKHCIDGGLQIPFPIEHAFLHGCTDVLVLLTRPASFSSPRPNRGARFMFNAICSWGNKGLYDAYATNHDRENLARDRVFGKAEIPVGVNIATVCPDESDTIQRSTVNPLTLHAAAINYGRKIMRLFGAPDADTWTLAPIQRNKT